MTGTTVHPSYIMACFLPVVKRWLNMMNILTEKDGGDTELLLYAMTLINKVVSLSLLINKVVSLSFLINKVVSLSLLINKVVSLSLLASAASINMTLCDELLSVLLLIGTAYP